MNRFILILSGLLLGLMTWNACGNKTKPEIKTGINDTLTGLHNLDLLIEENPNDPENYFARAQYHFQAENPMSAVADCQKAISLDSTKANYYILLGDLNFILRKMEETKICFKKAIDLEPDNVEALMKFGEFKLYLQDYDSMFLFVNRALRNDQYNSKGYFLKGIAYAEMGDTNSAVSSLQTCVEIDPEYFNAYMLLGTIFTAKRNPVSISYYQNAIDINPTKPEAYYGLAYYFQENGNPRGAINTYQSMLKVSPDNPSALHNIGYVYLFELNEKDSAIIYFDKAIRKDVRYLNAIYHRGYAYELKGNKVAAKTDYEAVLRMDENYRLAQSGLNRVK